MSYNCGSCCGRRTSGYGTYGYRSYGYGSGLCNQCPRFYTGRYGGYPGNGRFGRHGGYSVNNSSF